MEIKQLKYEFILVLFIVTMIGSSAVGGTVSVGLTYNFETVNTQTYVNQYNDKYTSVNDQFQKITVEGLNATNLNYTSTVTQNGYSYATLQNGMWSQSDSNSKVITNTVNKINLTAQMNSLSFTFDFYDNPTWNPAWNATYLNQLYPGFNYQYKYQYFDQKNESNPDNIMISYQLPPVIKSSEVQQFITHIKDRINDRLAGTVNSFKTLYFNASSYDDPTFANLNNNWFTWTQTNVKPNVAYYYNLINPIQGVVQLTPQWIGRFNYLGQFTSFNYTTGNYQPSMPYLTITNIPITYNGYVFQIQSNSNNYYNQLPTPSLFSLTQLNQRQPDYSKYVSVTTNGLSLSVHASTLYEEPPSQDNNNYYYPYSNQISHFNNPDNQLTGTYSFNLNLQYDSNGFLVKEISNQVYNGGSYGTYTVSNQLTQTTSTTNNFLNPTLVIEVAAVPVSIGSGIGVAYFLKKRRGN